MQEWSSGADTVLRGGSGAAESREAEGSYFASGSGEESKLCGSEIGSVAE